MSDFAPLLARSVAHLAMVACALTLTAAGPARVGTAPRPAGRAGVVLDLEPSAVGPGATLRAERDPSLARSTDGLELLALPDGSRRVDLHGRFRAYSVVTIAADGTLRMACADDPAAAIAMARAAARLTPTRRATFGPREE